MFALSKIPLGVLLVFSRSYIGLLCDLSWLCFRWTAVRIRLAVWWRYVGMWFGKLGDLCMGCTWALCWVRGSFMLDFCGRKWDVCGICVGVLCELCWCSVGHMLDVCGLHVERM